MYLRSVAALLLSSVVVVATTAVSTAESSHHVKSPEEEIADGVIAWVREKGGYWNDKVEIRRVVVSDEVSYLGVFAAQDLQANEKVMNIPRDCYIDVLNEEDAPRLFTEDESFRNYYTNVCMLSRKVQRELDLDEKSDYAPYIAYLKHQGHGQLPATWSQEGKELLRTVLSPQQRDVVDWIDMYYTKDSDETIQCLPDNHSPEDQHILAMTVQRCYDTALIPLWDMVNHDNGRINTNSTSIYSDEGVTIFASENIAAGAEILATYDKCLDCMDISDYWGTPEILRDFGFVERNAQRWVFEEHELWFELYEQQNGSKALYWDDNEIYGDISDSSDPIVWGAPQTSGNKTDFLVGELDRLLKVDIPAAARVPSFERSTVVQFREAAINALSLALESVGVQQQQQASDDTCTSVP